MQEQLISYEVGKTDLLRTFVCLFVLASRKSYSIDLDGIFSVV